MQVDEDFYCPLSFETRRNVLGFIDGVGDWLVEVDCLVDFV